MAVIDIYSTKRRYATVLADPPWAYQALGPNLRGGLEYPTLDIDELSALPVPRLLVDDAELWLWTTNPFLHDALHLIEAWGFAYRTKRTWVKANWGTGFWMRSQTEDLLFAVRGKPKRAQLGQGRRNGNSPPSTLLVTRDTLPHSRKPREAYEEIERLSGTPRLELFARRPRRGWDAWGLDATEEDTDLRADMEEALQ